jgi:hypothetical protein
MSYQWWELSENGLILIGRKTSVFFLACAIELVDKTTANRITNSFLKRNLISGMLILFEIIKINFPITESEKPTPGIRK